MNDMATNRGVPGDNLRSGIQETKAVPLLYQELPVYTLGIEWRITAGGLVANSSFQYLVLAIHALMLRDGFSAAISMNYSESGSYCDYIDVRKRTFLCPNWNIDPYSVNLVYTWSDMTIQFLCEDTAGTLVLVLQVLCSHGEAFASHLELSVEKFVKEEYLRQYKLEKEKLLHCEIATLLDNVLSAALHARSSALNKTEGLSVEASPNPPKSVISAPNPPRSPLPRSNRLGYPIHQDALYETCHEISSPISVVSLCSPSIHTHKRPRADSVKVVAADWDEPRGALLLPPPPLHIPLQSDLLPRNRSISNEKSPLLPSREDFLPDFTRPAQGKQVQRLPSFEEVFVQTGPAGSVDSAAFACCLIPALRRCDVDLLLPAWLLAALDRAD